MRTLVMLGAAAAFSGCMDSAKYAGALGEFGADPGGAQDIAFARKQIQEGQVPAAGAISVEGLLSEHDLPTVGPPCEAALCLRPALGIAPSLETGEREHWLHLGMTSGLDPQTFRRPPLDVVVVVDKSGSMSVDMAQTTEAVARMIDKLREDDRISVLAFDDAVHELKAMGPPGDRAALKAQVKAVAAGGGFDLEPAMARAFRIARDAGADDARLRRVMLFACSAPSGGEEDPVTKHVREGAAERIGFSFFGVLVGFNPNLNDLLGQVHGGASYYLNDLAKVEQVFDADFDVMLTPLAYDLRIEVETAPEFELVRVYGIPGDAEGAPRSKLEVATAFLSHRRGGLVARLRRRPEADPGAGLGTVRLAYAGEPALGLAARDESFPVRSSELDIGDGPHFESPGVRKAVALVNQALSMRAACEAHAKGERASATATLERLLAYLRAEAEALDDAGLRNEVALVEQLLANVAR